MQRDVQYNELFIRKTINDDNKEYFEIPTLHMILLYCEWITTHKTLLQVSDHVSRRIAHYDDTFLDKFNALLDDSAFAEELSQILGESLIKYASTAIGGGEIAIPLGLAPSFNLFNKGCVKCRTPRFIRSFCLYCGNTHSIGNELSYSYIPPSRSKRSKAADNSSDRKVNGKLSTGKLALIADSSSAGASTSTSHNIKTFSLQSLLALSKQNSITSSSINTVPEVAVSSEVVEVVAPVKKDIIVIDLVDSSDEDDIATKPSTTVPVANVSVKLESYKTLALPNKTMTATATGMSIASLIKPNPEEYSEEHSSSEMDVSEEHSLVPVKLEWPAQRMNKYEMAAMRGIAALYKYSQGPLNPGDKLFLMRNLATSCTGLHRIAARCCFKNLCSQWSAAHTSCHGNDSSTSDVMDVVEGAFVMSQLVCPGSPSWAMFQEKASAEQEEGASNTTTTSSIPIIPVLTFPTGAAVATTNTATASTLYENPEGQQESEGDFEARIEVALACSNLKYMIYSLTGDRHYYTLQDESSYKNHSETIFLTDEVNNSTTGGSNNPGEDANLSAKKPRHSRSPQQQQEEELCVLKSLPYSEFIDYPDGYIHPPHHLLSNSGSCSTTTTNPNSNNNNNSAAAVAIVSKATSTDSGNNSKRSRQQMILPSTRNNPLRGAKQTLFQKLSEEYEDSDQFGDVSPEIAKEFMEYTQVRASCRVFLKDNLKFMSLADFLGFDLDRFILPTPASAVTTTSGSSNRKRNCDMNSDISSCSSNNQHTTTVKQAQSRQSSQNQSFRGRRNIDYIGENCIDSKFHNAETFTGALCWSYITEEIGFDADQQIDKTSANYQVKDSTLSKVIRKFTHIRIYHNIKHFQTASTATSTSTREIENKNYEAYKKQCYLVTHIIYAFSDWGQHALRRELFAEEYEFIVTNMSDVMHILKDAELVGEFLQCLRILQYTPARDTRLVELFTAGLDFLLQVERDLSSMGRWVPTRNAKKEDAYTQYHATYCAVVGLVECNFAKDERELFNPPTPRILRHLRSES